MMTKAMSTVLMILLLAAQLSPQKGTGQGEFKEFPVDEPGYEGMSYHLFTPRGAQPQRLLPLVFALHGNGQNARNHVRNIARISTAEHPLFVVAPKYQKEAKFNAPVYPNAVKIFDKILSKVLQEEAIDTSRVVLQGFSMGSNYSTAWINHSSSQRGTKDDFPFCAVWLNGTAVPPRMPAPKLPYLLFVGEKETAVLGRINVLESVRAGYRSMFKSGLDVRYIEIPNMGHAVNTECHRLMREHVASMPDRTGAVPAKLGKAFAGVQELCLKGQFAEALAELDKVLQTGNFSRKSKARSLRGRVISYIKKLASALGKKKHATVQDYRQLSRLSESLAAQSTLTYTMKTALKKLEKKKSLALELSAWRAFVAAQELAKKDWNKSVAGIKSIADGPNKDTRYGLRARAHMQALGEDYPSPYSDSAGRKTKKRGRKKRN